MTNILFKELIEKLDGKVIILNPKESARASALFEETFPLTEWGKIDWDKIKNKIYLGEDCPEKIVDGLKKLLGPNFDQKVYVEWSEAGPFVIKTDIYSLVNCFDDFISVSMEKFIFNLDQKYIVEIRHLGDINVGILE